MTIPETEHEIESPDDHQFTVAQRDPSYGFPAVIRQEYDDGDYSQVRSMEVHRSEIDPLIEALAECSVGPTQIEAEAFGAGLLVATMLLSLGDPLSHPCVRCGEQTASSVDALGVEFPMCQGCQE